MKTLLLPFILQVVGILVIVAEIVIPSAGILTVVSIGLIGYSLYLVFTTLSTTAAMLFVAADIILIPAAIFVGLKLLVKSPATLNTSLSKEDGVVSQSPELDGYLGMEGEALSDLRPSGTAMINESKADVVTRGEYIEKGTAITVVSVTGNQIIVGIKEQP